MLKIYLCNDNVIISKETSLLEARKILDVYNFTVTKTDNVIIYHGKSQLDVVEKTVVHLYFDLETEFLQAAVVHIFPLNYEYVQQYLISRYGEPTTYKSDCEAIWNFTDGEITHSIIDRFGDEEGIYVNYVRSVDRNLL